MTMAPMLGYWNIRGYAQPIRLLLAYTETPFEDKKYAYGPAPDYDKRAWRDEMDTHGLDFPNLPYYIDGDVKITQSIAIMRYLGRKFKLVGETEEEKIRADVIEQQMVDMRTTLFSVCYNPDFEKLKVDFIKNLPAALKLVSDFLGKRQWFASKNKLTYVDFLIYEVLDNHKLLVPDCLNDFQNLKDFCERFENVPTISQYLQSPDFMKYPVTGDRALFGSRFSKK